MPIYEYTCDGCGHDLEALQALSDPPLTACPACHEALLRKRISTVAFRLKGSGWYETDFKKDHRRNLAGDGNAESTQSGQGEQSNSGNTKSGSSGEGKGKSESSERGSGKAREGSGSGGGENTVSKDKSKSSANAE